MFFLLIVSGKEDYDFKFGFFNDVLNVFDLENCLIGKEKWIGGWDLFWEDGFILVDDGNMECIFNGIIVFIFNLFLGGLYYVLIFWNDIYVCN